MLLRQKVAIAGLVLMTSFGSNTMLGQPSQEFAKSKDANPHLNMVLAKALQPVKASKVVTGEQIVQAAEKYKDYPYNFGGRNTTTAHNLDCLGLMFRTLEDAAGIDWKKFSVNPTTLIPQLGGKKYFRLLTPEVKQETFISGLEKGDFLFFLWPVKNEREPSIEKALAVDKNGKKVEANLWVWHTAIYAGNGKIIHASPFDENYRVLTQDLFSFMKKNEFAGFISVSWKGLLKK